MNPTEAIQKMVDDLLEGTDSFLVSFKVIPTHNYKIFLDADSGFNLEKCLKINRSLRNRIDEEGFFPTGDYSLEISSPGIDEPLVLHRQYLKNTERLVEVHFIDQEKLPIIGRLKQVNESEIILELTDKKKKIVSSITIQFSEIQKTIVQIEF